MYAFLLLIPVIKLAAYESIVIHKMLLGLGCILSISLNAAGTLKGILNISKSTSGVSILSPKVGNNSLIGILLCEVNTLLGMVMSYRLLSNYNRFPNDSNDFTLALNTGGLYFCSGLVMGVCGYATSVSVGIVTNAFIIMYGKRPDLFAKLLFYELMCAPIAVFGLVMAFILESNASSLK